jgi:hypothetical protein
MLLEFVVARSTGFMGAAALADEPASNRVVSILGLGGF